MPLSLYHTLKMKRHIDGTSKTALYLLCNLTLIFEKKEEDVMELEHNFYGVNFAPFPHRGMLSSENAHRSMTAMVEATAANWVILSPSGIQSGP